MNPLLFFETVQAVAGVFVATSLGNQGGSAQEDTSLWIRPCFLCFHPCPWNLVKDVFFCHLGLKLPDKVACVVSEHSGGELFSDRNVMWVQQWLCLSRKRTGIPFSCAPCDDLCCKQNDACLL